MFKPMRITPRELLAKVAAGDDLRFIDLRGDYLRTLPGAIPTQYEADLFYEQGDWVQDMLGVTFRPGQTVVVLCEFGHSAEEAVAHFHHKNKHAPFSVVALKGGWLAYEKELAQLVSGFRQGGVFLDELTCLETSVERFRHVARGLLEHKKGFLQRLLGGDAGRG